MYSPKPYPRAMLMPTLHEMSQFAYHNAIKHALDGLRSALRTIHANEEAPKLRWCELGGVGWRYAMSMSCRLQVWAASFTY